MANRSETLQAIFENMRLMERVMKRHHHRLFAKIGLGPSQLQLLMLIHQKQPLSHKQLAQYMQLTPGAITQLLEGLDKERFLHRTADPHDRRVVYLSLSKEGARKVAQIDKYRSELWADVLSTLDDHELVLYRKITEKMISYIGHKAKEEA